MSKKCDICGFSKNPNDANCCGNCGKSLRPSSVEKLTLCPGKYRWKVYDSNNYRLISASEYERLKTLEEELTSPLWKQQLVLLGKVWKRLMKIIDELSEGSAWILALLIIFVYLCAIYVRNFNNNISNKRITRIEVNGRYSIGYSKDKLLISSLYDSISNDQIGNQWALFNKPDKVGLAYISDSSSIIIEPSFKDIVRCDFCSILEGDKEYYFAHKGVITNQTDPYIKINSDKYWGENLLVLNQWRSADVFVVTHKNGKKDLLSKYGIILTHSNYSELYLDCDSVARAMTDDSKYTLLDYSGRQLSSTRFYRLRPFSNGVAWAQTSRNNSYKGIWILIDNKGNIKFHKKVPIYIPPVEYSNGIGWICNPSKQEQWTAIDLDGNKIFTLSKISKVYPYTMGIAPVKDIKSKVGFVDNKGITVIPYKYTLNYANPTFGSDSLMSVSLDGVNGKLHRNGKFYPNK